MLVFIGYYSYSANLSPETQNQLENYRLRISIALTYSSTLFSVNPSVLQANRGDAALTFRVAANSVTPPGVY